MKILELGSGPPPALDGGIDYLDSRDLPGLTYCQSAVDLSNIPDGIYDKVFSVDLIEHISWRDTVKALREWLRVLKPKGQLVIETPDAMELHRILDDPASVPDSRYGDESDFEMFCRTAFGHQDYPENSHLAYFTPEWLEILLKEAGATGIIISWRSRKRFEMRALKP